MIRSSQFNQRLALVEQPSHRPGNGEAVDGILLIREDVAKPSHQRQLFACVRVRLFLNRTSAIIRACTARLSSDIDRGSVKPHRTLIV